MPSGAPCSVTIFDDKNVSLSSVGSKHAVSPAMPSDFWHYLLTWGGKWMWTNIVNEGPDLQWLYDAVVNGTAIWVTDGSYNRDLAPNVSGAGWLVHCPTAGYRLYGSFYEVSKGAGSYRAELLGLLAIHTIAAALQQFFSIKHIVSKICCDNQGGLFKSKEFRRRVPTGASQADIQRSLRNVKVDLKGDITYEWVESHQDRYKTWEQLTLEQQLNCVCDALAKSAVSRSLRQNRPSTYLHLLPRERAAVFVAGIKQTADVAHDVRYELGKVEAERFYTQELNWPRSTFRSVHWEALDSLLATKSQMFKSWLSKQSSGFCGTQSMVSHWDASRDNKCPNCGQKETAAHLNVCPDVWRTKLFHDGVDKLRQWLESTYTDDELAYWIPKYIALRGTRKLSSFPFLSPALRQVAIAQDKIPWRCFMEGKICKELFNLQRRAITGSPSTLTFAAWSKKLLDQILHISHSQWIFRNVSLHDRQHGYLRLRRREQVLQEVDRLSELDATALLPESRYLLEIDFNELRSASAVEQSYWVYAMKAARRGGRRALQTTRGGASAAQQRRMSNRKKKKTQHSLSLGTLAVEREIEADFKLRARPTRKRPSIRATEMSYRSNRRWFPD